MDLLIILLSHPDADHINRVEYVIEKYKNQTKKKRDIVSFFCGKRVWNEGGIITSADTIDYLAENSSIFMPYYWRNELGSFPNFFAGNIMHLLTKAVGREDEISEDDVEILNKSNYEKVLKDFNEPLETIKDHVNILSMNTSAKTSNTYSSIIQFIMKDTELICTGDAEVSTIEEMRDGIKNMFLESNKRVAYK